jgi:uncharacterized membrane protein YkoI
MKKSIPFLSFILLSIFFLACAREHTVHQADEIEGSSITTEALSAKTNVPDEKEVEIAPDEVPDLIREAIEATYPGAELVEADHITRPDGSVYYDVEINHNDQKLELSYAENGEFLGIEEDDSDDDEEEDGE